jgi:DNA-binding beta-propeller fold protein YncE
MSMRLPMPMIQRTLRALALAMLVASCAQLPDRPAPARTGSMPVFPPPPEAPRFHYERTIYGSADVTPDDEEAGLRRIVTGEVRRTQLMEKPYGVAAMRGRVYVSDTVARLVHVFDVPAGRYSTFGTEEPGELRQPFGIDVDARGNVYVVDGALKAVLVFDAGGRFLRRLGSEAKLSRPAGIAVDPRGDRVYIVDVGGVDSGSHRVAVLDAASGAHLHDIGRRGTGPGEFNLPRDVALAPGGEVFVVDGGNFRVEVFAADGSFLREFGGIGRQGGQFSRPKEVAIGADGNVYVVDTAFGNFQIFDAEGRLLLDVGGRSNTDQPARFMLPSGIAVDLDGRVYLVDQYFRKVDVFRPASLAPTAGFALRAPVAARRP